MDLCFLFIVRHFTARFEMAQNVSNTTNVDGTCLYRFDTCRCPDHDLQSVGATAVRASTTVHWNLLVTFHSACLSRSFLGRITKTHHPHRRRRHNPIDPQSDGYPRIHCTPSRVYVSRSKGKYHRHPQRNRKFRIQSTEMRSFS